MSKAGANFGGTVGWDEQTVIGKYIFFYSNRLIVYYFIKQVNVHHVLEN
jgi:hypothetical protein